METTQPDSIEQSERLAVMVEHCLDSPSAYRLFSILSCVSRLGVRVKLEFLDLERETGGHTNEEMGAISRLTLSGAAKTFKEVVDHVRDEQVQHEIAALANQ